MSITLNEARDEMFGILQAMWIAPTFDPANLRWSDVAGDTPSLPVLWARGTIRHATGGQASLSGPVNGCVKFERKGTLFVQVFSPVGNGLTAAYDAAQLVANAYEKPPGGLTVWFRNVRINEIGTRGDFEQINVLADFIYDDAR